MHKKASEQVIKLSLELQRGGSLLVSQLIQPGKNYKVGAKVRYCVDPVLRAETRTFCVNSSTSSRKTSTSTTRSRETSKHKDPVRHAPHPPTAIRSRSSQKQDVAPDATVINSSP